MAIHSTLNQTMHTRHERRKRGWQTSWTRFWRSAPKQRSRFGGGKRNKGHILYGSIMHIENCGFRIRSQVFANYNEWSQCLVCKKKGLWHVM